MPSFELIFEVGGMDDALEDRLIEELDALPAYISGVWTVTLSQACVSALDAAQSALRDLRRLGAKPTRMVEDLVSRAEIAQRCGVSTQAVGLWMRGERRASTPAPTPLYTAGVDLWLWGEVVAWLHVAGRNGVDADLAFPSRVDHQVINGLIAGAMNWSMLTVRERLPFTVERAAEVSTVPAPNRATQRQHFGLAA